MILAWMGGELWCGQPQNGVNFDFQVNLTLKVTVDCPSKHQTDAGNDNTWKPQVKTVVLQCGFSIGIMINATSTLFQWFSLAKYVKFLIYFGQMILLPDECCKTSLRVSHCQHWFRTSGKGLVSWGNKPLPEPMQTEIYVIIWSHWATVS